MDNKYLKLGATLGILVVLVGGYLFFTKPSHAPVTDTVDEGKPEEPVATPQPLQIPVAPWKTYVSTGLGFEFNYPSEYIVKYENQNIYVEDPKTTLRYIFTINENPKNLTAMEYATHATLPTHDPISKLNLNDILGAETKVRMGDMENRVIWFPAGGKIIDLQYHLSDEYFIARNAINIKQIYLSNGEVLVASIKLHK